MTHIIYKNISLVGKKFGRYHISPLISCDSIAQALSDKQSPTFHPPRITRPKRVKEVTLGLLALPREIIHKIIDDLTLFEVLQVASCLDDSTYVDHCILGHSRYQHFFVSQDLLTEARDLFIVFSELRASLNLGQPAEGSYLADMLSFSKSRYFHRLLIDAIEKDVTKILTALSANYIATLIESSQDLQARELEPLRAYNSTDCQTPYTRWHLGRSSSCQTLYDRWKLLTALQENINHLKAAQLTRMAVLCEAFPGLLKWCNDPSQKASQDTKRIATKLGVWARLVGRNQWLKHGKGLKGQSLFRYHLLPLVPFDWCLRLFIRHMHLNPPVAFQASMMENTDKGAVKNRKPRQYPARIVQDIKTVLSGISYIYTTAAPGSKGSPPSVQRTKFTPYSVPFQRAYSRDGTQDVGSTAPQWYHWRRPNQQRKTAVQNLRPQKDIESPIHWQPLDESALCSKKDRQHRTAIIFPEPACADECWDRNHEHPVFTSPPCKHFIDLHESKVVKSALPTWERLMPYDEREFEWLEAFLRVVSFMKKTEEGEHEEFEDAFAKLVVNDESS